jgi:4'-phosphopantetheinyl transferase
MPLLLLSHPAPSATFALWKLGEPESFFRANLPLSSTEEEEFYRFKGIRQQEWLASRWLLHKLTGAEQRLELGKDTFSKPFFLHYPERHCSLSHSLGIVGALLSDNICGCDIQVLVDKMPRLAHKFLRQEEAEFVHSHSVAEQFELLHVFWTAKESLYKAYGLKALDFRAHIRVEPFTWEYNLTAARGWVEKGDYTRAFQLYSAKLEVEEGVALVWTVCLPTD